jgi:hypothetical protein
VIGLSSQTRPIAHRWDILFESGRCDWDEWQPSSASRVLGRGLATFRRLLNLRKQIESIVDPYCLILSEAKDLRE